MRELQPMKSNGATCAVKMPTLQNSTPWTGPAARFSHSGARILKNMSPKTRPVKRCLEKDGPQPGFKAGFRGLGSEIRFQVSGIAWKNYTNLSFTGFRFSFTVFLFIVSLPIPLPKVCRTCRLSIRYSISQAMPFSAPFF